MVFCWPYMCSPPKSIKESSCIDKHLQNCYICILYHKEASCAVLLGAFSLSLPSQNFIWALQDLAHPTLKITIWQCKWFSWLVENHILNKKYNSPRIDNFPRASLVTDKANNCYINNISVCYTNMHLQSTIARRQ